MRMAGENKDITVIALGGALVALLVFWIFYTNISPPRIQKSEEIKLNETAFLIPLDSKAADYKNGFASQEFLEQNKVDSLEVTIPQRKIAVGRFTYRWVPDAQLVKVDRTPVTQDWMVTPPKPETQPSNQTNAGAVSQTSSSNQNTQAAPKSESTEQDEQLPAVQPITVESNDGIEFAINITITTSIPEKWAARFLANFAGKTLSDVTREDIHAYVENILSSEFGNRSVDECRRQKKAVFDLALKQSKAYFAEKGVAIDSLSYSRGFVYMNKSIQSAVDAETVAQLAVNRAHQDRLAQEERNKTIVEKAAAENEASQEFAKGSDAAITRKNLEIEMIKAEALETASEKWNGYLPANIIPQGSALLFGLDRITPPSAANNRSR